MLFKEGGGGEEDVLFPRMFSYHLPGIQASSHHPGQLDHRRSMVVCWAATRKKWLEEGRQDEWMEENMEVFNLLRVVLHATYYWSFSFAIVFGWHNGFGHSTPGSRSNRIQVGLSPVYLI